MDVAQMAGHHIPAGIPSTLQRHLGYNSTGPGSRYADYTPHKHRGPGFDRWLLLSEARHQICVNTKHKRDFFAELEGNYTVQVGKILLQASIGKAYISIVVSVRCLVKIGCPIIRLSKHGQLDDLCRCGI